MSKVIFYCLCVCMCLSACQNTNDPTGTPTESSSNSVVTVSPPEMADDPVAFLKMAMENHCRVKSQGYLELINFQKVDGVRAKDLRGIDTYRIKCSYQVRGVKSGGYLDQCRPDQNLSGATVSLSPSHDDCFNYPVEQGVVYDLKPTDIGTYSENFSFVLEKHDSGWVFAQNN